MKLSYTFNTISLKNGQVSQSGSSKEFGSRAEAINDANRQLAFLYIAGFEIVEMKSEKTDKKFVTLRTTETFRVISPAINDERLIAGSLKSHRKEVAKTLNSLRIEQD